MTETDALTLPTDYDTLRDDELEALWERAAFSRQELLDVLAKMPATALKWRVDDKAWSIYDILGHVARADLWYASRLEESGLRELVWRISAVRALLLQHLQSLPVDERAHVTQHDSEDWTPRKVARRMLEHEQEHLAQIREILKKVQ